MLMSFDSVPESPRDIWLHTIHGYIVALRVPNKPYPILPGIDRRGLPGAGLVRAIYEQTGLVVAHCTTIDNPRCGSWLFDSEVLAGSLRASTHGVPELVHPDEFKLSPEAEWLENLLDPNPRPLSYVEVSVRPEDLMPSDRTTLLVSGVRIEYTNSGGPLVGVQYENFVQATLGADDQATPGAFGDEVAAPTDGEVKDATRSDARRGKPAAIGDPARASRVWTPINGGAGLRIYRLGGSLLGPST